MNCILIVSDCLTIGVAVHFALADLFVLIHYMIVEMLDEIEAVKFKEIIFISPFHFP
ncbi:hypothetical protein H7J92_04155 [Sporosarcina aquimarina]|nr:hypothetical protein [Sporosarcina aquimarina]